MLQYVIRRSVWVVLVVLVVTMITYAIFFLLPSTDPAVAFAGKQPTPELIAEVKEQLGLDKSVPEQYWLYVKRLVTGDRYGWPGFGQSFNTRSPVLDEITTRAPRTLWLIAGGAVLWLLIGIPVGILSALKRRTWVDRTVMGFALFGISAPVFWLGLVSLYIFWKILGWLPGTGYTPFTESPWEWFTHLILPWAVLALLFAAIYARVVRGNLLDTLSEDYIRTARAKGLTERRVVGKHALRAGIAPIITLLGIDLAVLVGGTIVTETVFNIQGLGNYVLVSTYDGDLPAVLAVVVLTSICVAVMSLVVDIVYAYLDPRVRYR
ncbi:MAG: ABC transporter permease [Thermoleophilia bacterium]